MKNGMEKGIITVTKTKNYFITIIKDNGKKLTPPFNGFDESFLKGLPQNMEVYYELDDKYFLIKVCKDKDKKEIIFPCHNSNSLNVQHINDITQNTELPTTDKAHAPYNFIPVNKSVIPDLKQDDEKILTGYIDLEITTKTPLFIRGIGEKFFGAEYPVIPGSSLRGMIRTLVEIVSYSELKFTDKKKRFFYRNIGEPFYRDKFIETQKISPPLVKMKVYSGWLTKNNNQYYITPSGIDSNHRQYYRINGSFIKRNTYFRPKKFDFVNTTWIDAGFEVPVYDFMKVFFDPTKVDKIKHKPNFNLEYWTLKEFSQTKSIASSQEGYLIASGAFATKKHYQWVINKAGNASTAVNVSKLIEEYQMDDNREEDADLIKMLRTKNNQAIPCFYLTDNKNQIIALGHTGIFRLAYQYNVGTLLKQKQEDFPDFTDSMFGTQEQSSRVFFEDGLPLKEDGVEVYSNPIRLNILQSPRPTSFQHYLEQPNGVNTSKSALHNWGNQNSQIKGFKLYWHRDTPDEMTQKDSWAFNMSDIIDFNKKKNILSEPVIPVKREQKFMARLRFVDITEKELGCLLMVLDLPNGCFHKLGMGKPYGLGSVEIKPNLTIIDLKKRYSLLIDSSANEWEEGAINVEINSFKNSFTVYMNDQLGTSYSDFLSFWHNDSRLKELLEMLSFTHNEYSTEEWLGKTKYMEIERLKFDAHGNQLFKENGKPDTKNEYENRPVLTSPTKYIKKP